MGRQQKCRTSGGQCSDPPSKMSTMLKNASDREDFPLPVRPQIPTYISRRTGAGQSASLWHSGETSGTPVITEWRLRAEIEHKVSAHGWLRFQRKRPLMRLYWCTPRGWRRVRRFCVHFKVYYYKTSSFCQNQVYTRQENTVPQQQTGEWAGLHCPYKNIKPSSSRLWRRWLRGFVLITFCPGVM